jgi:hypothetical protein
MAGRLAPQVAQVCSLVSAGPTISVEKVSLLCYPASGTRSQALQLRLLIGSTIAVAKAKVFLHLKAQERVGRGITHLKDI